MALMLMDWDFHLLGELPYYTSLALTRSYGGLGSFTLQIARQAAGTEGLQEGRILFFSDALHKAMLIDKVAVKDGKITASGKPLKGIAASRVCVPPLVDEGFFGWDRFIGSAEAAYHHYAAANLYAPEDGKRKIPRLVPGENKDRGIVMPWQSRFGELHALFSDIGEVTEMGWDIRPNFAEKQYVFGAWMGRDLTTGNQRVVLSDRNRNVDKASLTLDASAYRSTVYVGGTGEDENRLIRSEGNESAGILRREVWVDAGSIGETEMLRVAAQNKLDTAVKKQTLTAELLDNGLCRYEQDYDVGDRVTVEGEGAVMNARLLEMTEVYEGGARKLTATFGDAPVTFAKELRGTIFPVVR